MTEYVSLSPGPAVVTGLALVLRPASTQVALKTINPELRHQADLRRRFEREAEVMAMDSGRLHRPGAGRGAAGGRRGPGGAADGTPGPGPAAPDADSLRGQLTRGRRTLVI